MAVKVHSCSALCLQTMWSYICTAGSRVKSQSSAWFVFSSYWQSPVWFLFQISFWSQNRVRRFIYWDGLDLSVINSLIWFILVPRKQKTRGSSFASPSPSAVSENRWILFHQDSVFISVMLILFTLQYKSSRYDSESYINKTEMNWSKCCTSRSSSVFLVSSKAEQNKHIWAI